MAESQKLEGADVLTQAITELGEVRERLVALRAQTDALRRRNDLPPEMRELLAFMASQQATLEAALGLLGGEAGEVEP